MRSEESQRLRFLDAAGGGSQRPAAARADEPARRFPRRHCRTIQPLYQVHEKIDVPPLREAAAARGGEPAGRSCSRRASRPMGWPPISRGGRRRNPPRTPARCRFFRISLDDMWTAMVKRGDGVLRLPAQAIELGGVLVDRANALSGALSRRLRRRSGAC